MPLFGYEISETVCHIPLIMTSTDSWDAVDLHVNCYFDLDVFAFPKGHEKRFLTSYLGWVCGSGFWVTA